MLFSIQALAKPVSPTKIAAQEWTQTVLPNTSGTYYGMAVFDMNEDGRQDVVTSKYNQGIEVWLNTGMGWNKLETNLPKMEFYRQIAVTDINLDNKPDIVGIKDRGGIKLWTGRGEGKWDQCWSDLSSKDRYFDVKVVDLNSDGIKEIIAATSKGIKIWIPVFITGLHLLILTLMQGWIWL